MAWFPGVPAAAGRIGIFVANETSSPGTSTTRQVAAIRPACGQWVDGEQVGAAAPCSAMADWMGQQVAEGHVAGQVSGKVAASDVWEDDAVHRGRRPASSRRVATKDTGPPSGARC